jgi:hypothetical protein
LENATGIATLTDLGGGQYKITRVGSASGSVNLKAVKGSEEANRTIFIGNPTGQNIKDSSGLSTLQPNTVYNFYLEQGFDISSYSWSVTGGTIISGQNSNILEVRTDANPYQALNNLSITLNYVGSCGSGTIGVTRWVAPGGGDTPDPGEIL